MNQLKEEVKEMVKTVRARLVKDLRKSEDAAEQADGNDGIRRIISGGKDDEGSEGDSNSLADSRCEPVNNEVDSSNLGPIVSYELVQEMHWWMVFLPMEIGAGFCVLLVFCYCGLAVCVICRQKKEDVADKGETGWTTQGQDG